MYGGSFPLALGAHRVYIMGMDITVAQYAARYSLSANYVRGFVAAGLVPGARKVGGRWMVPDTASKFLLGHGWRRRPPIANHLFAREWGARLRPPITAETARIWCSEGRVPAAKLYGTWYVAPDTPDPRPQSRVRNKPMRVGNSRQMAAKSRLMELSHAH